MHIFKLLWPKIFLILNLFLILTTDWNPNWRKACCHCCSFFHPWWIRNPSDCCCCWENGITSNCKGNSWKSGIPKFEHPKHKGTAYWTWFWMFGWSRWIFGSCGGTWMGSSVFPDPNNRNCSYRPWRICYSSFIKRNVWDQSFTVNCLCWAWRTRHHRCYCDMWHFERGCAVDCWQVHLEGFVFLLYLNYFLGACLHCLLASCLSEM